MITNHELTEEVNISVNSGQPSARLVEMISELIDEVFARKQYLTALNDTQRSELRYEIIAKATDHGILSQINTEFVDHLISYFNQIIACSYTRYLCRLKK